MGGTFLGQPVFLPKQGKTKLRVQRKQNIDTSPAHAPKQHTAGQGAKHECAQGTLMSIIRIQNLQPQKINVPWYRINPILLQSNLLYLGLRSRLTAPVQNSCKARNMQKVNEKSQVSPKHRQTITIHSPKEVSLLRKTTTSKANLPL